MRTTVDLPPVVRQRVEEIARLRGDSLSSVVSELTIRGLSQLDEPVQITIDSASGFPVLGIKTRVTSEDVVALLDEE